ncbi:hypothetical protein B0H67DRAFT_484488 [Lasiosphaeris hirsuta]|uniref:Uncharacterized protein n=1 Tax=Lasiosphaeris hirsuta TaxID=260670 RepID=A0AA40AQM1_9PEZI|nr:hypothetical protein B0H67DRAFT_484488 [Lasiosphaeris hirsuta]
MDDPWGSPWTAPSPEKGGKPSSPTKSAKSDLEPPPRAFFSISNSPRIPAISGQSPWADDDDGIGDWASADAPATAQSGWGGGWSAPSPNLASPPRHDEFSKPSPIAWPGSIALPKPANGSIPSIRQPSPDPWSTDFSPSIDGPSTLRLVIDAPPLSSVERAEVGTGDIGAQLDLDRDWHETKLSEADIGNGTLGRFPAEEHAVEKSTSAENQVDGMSQDVVRPSVESGTQSHESPFGSLSGDDTDRENDRQDSPITSIDEDSKTRQPVARTTSGKVQQLVEKFDGLARALSEEPVTTKTERSKSPIGLNQKESCDDVGEFGGFEDIDQDRPLPASALDRPATPKPTAKSSTPTTSAAASPQSSTDSTIHIKQVLAAHGPVAFDIDLGNIEKLFSLEKSTLATKVSEANSEVSDYIITDSFGEISERKTWYRVSRMGSLRKYNAGDDENYRLVAWPTSTIRQDTIKIVRRWMEEDSIAGRVTLGGGISKTQKNMFGWDSSAEPVTLDAVFGKRKGHSRATSLQPLAGPPLRKTSGSLRSPIHRPSSVVVPPVASFGWSSNSPTSPPLQTQPAKSIPPLARPVAAPQPSSTLQHSMPQISALEKLPPNAAAIRIPTSTPKEDDDDEWGEMVTSPSDSKPAATDFQSLSNAFSVPPQGFPTPQSGTRSAPLVNEAEGPATASVGIATGSSTASGPWEAVDFSVFESPPKRSAAVSMVKPPKPAAAPAPPPPMMATPFTPSTPIPIFSPTPFTETPIASPGTELVVRSATSKQLLSEYTFSPTTPLEISSPTVLPVASAAEDDTDIGNGLATRSDDVGHIIANLPDLSYMLR